MGWAGEASFLDLLERNSRKLSKDGLDRLASIAVADEFECYKHVAALLERQMRKGKDKQRVNVLHVLSHIVRRSTRKHGQKDKYVKRLEGRLVAIGKLLREVPSEHWARIQRVVGAWRRERVFAKESLDSLGKVLPEMCSAPVEGVSEGVRRSARNKAMVHGNGPTPKSKAPVVPPPEEAQQASPGSSAVVESTAAPAVDGAELYDPYRDVASGPPSALPPSMPPVPVPPPMPVPQPAPALPPAPVHPPLPSANAAPVTVPPCPPIVPSVLPGPLAMAYGSEHTYGYNQFAPGLPHPSAPALPPPFPLYSVPPPQGLPPPIHGSLPPHLPSLGTIPAVPPPVPAPPSMPPHLLNPTPLPPSHPLPLPGPPLLYPVAQPPPPPSPPPPVPSQVGSTAPYSVPPPPPLLPPPMLHDTLPPGLGPAPAGQATEAAPPALPAAREAAVSSSGGVVRKRSEEASNLGDVDTASKRLRSSRWGPPSCDQGTDPHVGTQGPNVSDSNRGKDANDGQQCAESRCGPQPHERGIPSHGLQGADASAGSQGLSVRRDVDVLIEKARGLAAAMSRPESNRMEVQGAGTREGSADDNIGLGGVGPPPQLPASLGELDDGGSVDMSLGQSGGVPAAASLGVAPFPQGRDAQEAASTLVSQPPLPPPPASPPPLPPPPPPPTSQTKPGGEGEGMQIGDRSALDAWNRLSSEGMGLLARAAKEPGVVPNEEVAVQL
ncbi:unnamed protein product [Ostreobium quekettii]|uniref:CID domain-containing protein n=1 Tax=Ostreobium quekettii TaxID=121088 RepID=A0A8S1J2Z8_9CHLO|nr:unnamed protein product [Ostreobium quekettii]